MDFTQTLDHFKNEGALTNIMAQHLLALEQSMMEYAQQDKPYNDYIGLLDSRSNQITNDESMNCAEREFLLNITSTLKGYIQFAAENSAFKQFFSNAAQDRGCFWEWLGCFFKTLIKDIIIGAIIGGTLGLILDTDTATSSGGGLVITGPLTAIGAVVGAIAGLFHAAFSADECCPNELDCRLPAGVSLRFVNCAATATYTPWGFGTDVGALVWNNMFGMPTSAITTAPHSLSITQDVPGTPVSTSFSTVCVDGSTNAPSAPVFLRNLSSLVLDVGEFTIIGKKSISSGLPYVYSVQGTAAYDGRHTFDFFVTRGTITVQGPSQITVIWDDFEPGQQGRVSVTARNTCPGGRSVGKSIYVDDDL